jgi:2-keto-4-pentenoate hydratase/2-oxohepta-3-ene-1,7-dioic acid hydratase in catechol pathway
MLMKIPEIIEFITTYITLQPGDVIATGTPAGVGLFTGNILKDGDIIEATVEKIGTLRNTVKKM